MPHSDIPSLPSSLGDRPPPNDIWQDPIDGDKSPYRRLCQHRRGMPNPVDLLHYAQDLAYRERLQPELFHYLLPICLNAWHWNLNHDGQTEYADFVELFCLSLAERPLLATHLTPEESSAVTGFMRDAILARVGAGPADTWLPSVATFATAFSTLKSLWLEWWEMATHGHAVGALQYISCLVYPDSENPWFKTKTVRASGHPPRLWVSEAPGGEQFWKPENIRFLTTVLTPDYLCDALSRATWVLEDRERSAERFKADFDRYRTLLERRLAALPEILASPLRHGGAWPA